MRLSLALRGDLKKVMAEEYLKTETAVTRAVKAAGEGLKTDLRAEVVGAGLGRRLANTWRSQAYPKSGVSAGAASLVWSKAPKLIGAHADGATIRATSGLWLAIPLPAAGKGRGGRRITPGEWEQRSGAKLRFVYRRGRTGLLVADAFRVSKSGTARQSRAKTGRGAQTVPIFVLVKQVRLKKRLSPEPKLRSWGGRLVPLIEREFAALDAGSGG